MTRPTGKASTKPMAMIRIGYTSILLPADAALKVAGLLTGAVECDQDYSSSRHRSLFRVKEDALQVTVEMAATDQIVMPTARTVSSAGGPPRLGAPRSFGFGEDL